MATRSVKEHNLKAGQVLETFEMDGVTRKRYGFYEILRVNPNGTVDVQALEVGYLGLHKVVPIIGTNYGPIHTKTVRKDDTTFDIEGYYVAIERTLRATRKRL